MVIPERIKLYQVLPLRTPLSFHVFPIHSCNFKCKYCLHSLSSDKLTEIGFKKERLPLKIFKKAIDDLQLFPQPVKSLVFAGHGEPLLHPDIAEMVAYAKEKKVADRVEIVTNGSLLSHDLGKNLVMAGLDRLRISIQGINEDVYQTVAGVPIDLEQFISNIHYFYSMKNKTEIYIKIIDMALKSDEEEKKFFDLFGPVADTIAIEYTIPFVNEIDLSGDVPLERAKQGHRPRETMVCPMPFYQMVLLPSGKVTGCCAVRPPVIYGTVMNESLLGMWESISRNNFLHTQLTNRWKNEVCRACSVPKYGLQPGDDLDPYKEFLLECYSNRT